MGKVIEDAAQALLSKYEDKYLGTIGHIGTLSFHETKNIISGESGALLLNDEGFIERAEIIWEKGTNRKKFFRGEVDKYTWVNVGSSFLPSEMVAAFLAAQLEHAEKIICTRCELLELYTRLLTPLAELGFVRLPWVDKTGVSNGHIYNIIVQSSEERTRLISHLRSRNIHAVFHYVPLHSSPAGGKCGRASGELPYTDDLSTRVLEVTIVL